jgi:hypothetical protein
MAHSRRRLVEQHDARLERERRGDLQRPLLAVGEGRGQRVAVVVDADLFEQFLGASVERRDRQN